MVFLTFGSRPVQALAESQERAASLVEDVPMTNPVLRPLRAGEHKLFRSMPEPPIVGAALLGRDFAETMAARQYRPEWTWVALDGDTVIARAAWWGGPDDSAPVALDWFDPGTASLARRHQSRGLGNQARNSRSSARAASTPSRSIA